MSPDFILFSFLQDIMGKNNRYTNLHILASDVNVLVPQSFDSFMFFFHYKTRATHPTSMKIVVLAEEYGNLPPSEIYIFFTNVTHDMLPKSHVC